MSQTTATLKELLAIPGVTGAYSAETSLDKISFPPDLTDQERLFAMAWISKHKVKNRVGDQCNWDAPGMQPPDPH